jgi:hypothetical protein
MLIGRPSTKPTALRSAAIGSSRAASALKALRWSVSTPVASRRSGSETANADGLGAEIEARQRAALGPMRDGFDQGENGARAWVPLNTRPSAERKADHGVASHAETPRHRRCGLTGSQPG